MGQSKTVADEFTAGEAESEPTVVTINETLTSERLDRYPVSYTHLTLPTKA